MGKGEQFNGGVDKALARNRDSEAATSGAPDSQLLLGLYRQMQLVREVELTIESMHKLGRMSGSFHSSLGQEACAVGVCSVLRTSDIVTSTHRGHGHAVAKGVPIEGIFAELLGKTDGVSGGRGGSMHLHHRDSGFYGETAIVGGGVAWAAGAAWARRQRGLEDIAVAFIGDGAFAQGITHETLLLARHWSSPCLIVCENNGLAHSMSSELLFGGYGKIATQVAASGVRAEFADGRSVLEVATVATELVREIRRTGQPGFLECGVYRVRPHSVSDADYRYRRREAGSEWLEAHDPIARARRALTAEGFATDEIDREVRQEIEHALTQAERAPVTSPTHATSCVYASPELQHRG
jgi:TPP-dependent pyruvate/acetoin dehydrogenase alpha subunit